MIELKNDCSRCEHAYKQELVVGYRQRAMYACEAQMCMFPSAIACTSFEQKKPEPEIFLDA